MLVHDRVASDAVEGHSCARSALAAPTASTSSSRAEATLSTGSGGARSPPTFAPSPATAWGDGCRRQRTSSGCIPSTVLLPSTQRIRRREVLVMTPSDAAAPVHDHTPPPNLVTE